MHGLVHTTTLESYGSGVLVAADPGGDDTATSDWFLVTALGTHFRVQTTLLSNKFWSKTVH